MPDSRGVPQSGKDSRLLIFDTQYISGLGLKSMLERCAVCEVAGIICTPALLSASVNKFHPGLVLVNAIHDPDDCMKASLLMKAEFPVIPVLAIVDPECETFFPSCDQFNLKGIVSGSATTLELFDALQTALSGGSYLPQAGLWSDPLQNNSSSLENTHSKKSVPLSRREVEILGYITEGLSHKEIAGRLYISPRTVESHKVNMLNKLSLKSTADLIRYAVQLQLV